MGISISSCKTELPLSAKLILHPPRIAQKTLRNKQAMIQKKNVQESSSNDGLRFGPLYSFLFRQNQTTKLFGKNGQHFALLEEIGLLFFSKAAKVFWKMDSTSPSFRENSVRVHILWGDRTACCLCSTSHARKKQLTSN